MRPLALIALHGLLATPVSAQDSQFKTTLVISVFAGGITGGTIWSQNRQPVSLINDMLTPVGTDTFSLRRSGGVGLTIGSSATLFMTPRFGFGVEVSYTGPAQDDDCSIVFSGTPSPGSPEARALNDAFCNRIAARSATLGSISLMAEGIFLVSPRASVRPYLRLAGGITDVGRSSAEVSGPFLAADLNGDGLADAVDRPIIIDDKSSTAGLTFGVGSGLLIPLSRGYSLRFEVRDQVFRRALPLGPADALGVSRIGKKWFHNPSIVLGIALNMQQSQGLIHRGR